MNLFIAKLKDNTDQWLEERLKLSAFTKFASKKVVPQHEHSIWYYFGGMAMFLFILQIITGLLLMVYYQPGVETSHASVQFIMDKVAYGELVRSIHSWSANLMIALIFVHMFSVYFVKAYKKPRELTWLTGFGLFMLSLGLGFSGYLLPWDKLSFFATKVGMQIMEQVPLIGSFMADLLRGGDSVGGDTISRFFALHVVLLPLAMMGLLGAHLLMVQLHGMSRPPSYEDKPQNLRKSIPFFSDFMYHDIFIWTLMLGGIILLSSALPWELGEKADPWAPAPEGIKPEWYFVFMFQILKMIPAYVGPIEGEIFGIMMFGLFGLIWALVPFWEGTNRFTEKLATWYGITVLIVILATTAISYTEKHETAATTPIVSSEVNVSPAPMTSIVKSSNDSAENSGKGATLFKQSCAACHSIGGGKLVGPDLKGITQTRSKDALAEFVVNPQGSAMPKIPGIEKESALVILEYIESESGSGQKKLTNNAVTATASEEKSFPQEDIENGRKIFSGIKHLAKGGTACIACHSVNGNGELGGGTLGPNLSDVYNKFGGRKALEAWLSSIPSPTMKPIYKDHPLQEEEISALVTYFEDISKRNEIKKADKEETDGYKFILIGFIGLVIGMVSIAIIYKNRLRSVRRSLVKSQNPDKEHKK